MKAVSKESITDLEADADRIDSVSEMSKLSCPLYRSLRTYLSSSATSILTGSVLLSGRILTSDDEFESDLELPAIGDPLRL